MEEKLKKDLTRKAAIIAVAAIVLIVLEAVGLVRVINKNREDYEEGARYSETVTAKIIKEDKLIAVSADSAKSGSTIYKYTYSYSFGGNNYERRSYDEVDESHRYNINDTAEIKVDPDAPENFYDPKTSDIGKGSNAPVTKRIVSMIFVAVLAAVIIAVMYFNMKKKLAAAGEPAANGLTDNQNNDIIQ